MDVTELNASGVELYQIKECSQFDEFLFSSVKKKSMSIVTN
jgi:hypothetical protein